MTVAATTELEAINIMLAAIGEAPINSLTGTLPSDVRIAQDTLTEVNKEVQSEGWSFNTEIDVTLTRDGSSQVSLSTDILRVDCARRASTGSVPARLLMGASPIAANIMLILSSSVVAATVIV